LQNELGGTTTNDSLPPTQKKRKVGQKTKGGFWEGFCEN